MESRPVTYHNGVWHEGNPPMLGPMTHALWMASVVFDGARAFRGLAPDLDRHCARAVASATAFGMAPKIDAAEIERLAWEGIARFAAGSELYIRPLFYIEDGFVAPDASTTRFLLTVFEAPLPPFEGVTACLSRFRRPTPEMAPTDAKAACLYPNVGRALIEARERGFSTAVVLDALGNVAEFATNNLFLVKNGVVHTPVANGSFLSGLTRRRVIALLTGEGYSVVERTITFDEVLAADEVFLTGNYPKLLPVTGIEDRSFPVGEVAATARRLYFAFAESTGAKPATAG
jgi:branched-chain amino acid aminotransferase